MGLVFFVAFQDGGHDQSTSEVRASCEGDSVPEARSRWFR